ncbi:hypothetical protein HMJ29_01325 [Hymenobacter taeanensis]|uniref:DUF4397 domain-containing protein n=1 Tax=Hymenobacter taeanensis TaxID=2735321 RepID=A0A6M6BBY0_9BACT|nr:MULTISPECIES: hypothetical protein [Hymenobacter]QJX45647.1 hypothetical protein HMJ29_01325 [Hymenobacter taeanensis]UOQ79483.1 hypothetical protein MUN83_11520 [Hymenobacter sp. 5414T-23]
MKLYTTARPWLNALVAPALGLLCFAASSCEKEPFDNHYTVQDASGFTILGLPNAGLAAKYAPGETAPVIIGYNANESPKDITVFQVINKQDSAVVGTYPANGQFLQSAQLTTQAVPYVVPANLANKTPVRVDVTLTFANGSKRMRRFTYTVASSPTLKFGATPATYRNGLAGTAQSTGDIIGYSVIINEGGISTLPAPAATPNATLFKAVDSLAYYYREGTQAPIRLGVVRNPTAGAANTRTVDIVVPAAASGKTINFVFVAYAQSTSATVTSAPIAIGGTTALATTRTGRVSFGPNSAPDSLAFNLKTGLNEPAANPVTAKDLFVSGVSGNTLVLSAANGTRYYKVPAAQVANGFYTKATANDVGTLIYQNTTAADLGAVAVNDVYAVKVRGTGETMLIRIVGTKNSTGGSTGRVRFEYRSL